MCLKTNLMEEKCKQEQAIINKCEQIKQIILDSIQREKLEKYELLRQTSKYNMLNTKARQITELSKEDYQYIIENYTELISKFSNTKEHVKRQFEYVKSVNIAKIVAIKGYENCIELVSNKLDVSEMIYVRSVKGF